MALTVIDHYPKINATGVFRNDTIQIGFNKPIVPGSVTWSVMSVHDARTFANVVGDLGLLWNTSGNCTGIYFTPEINYTANTNYSVYVYQSPEGVIATDQDEIHTTYSWSFLTGTTVLSSVPSGGLPGGTTPSGEDTTPSTPSESDGLSLSGFQVLRTYPSNQTPNVATNLSGIYIYFNADIVTPLSDLSGYISVTVNDVLY
jgi:hypothetical protein